MKTILFFFLTALSLNVIGQNTDPLSYHTARQLSDSSYSIKRPNGDSTIFIFEGNNSSNSDNYRTMSVNADSTQVIWQGLDQPADTLEIWGTAGNADSSYIQIIRQDDSTIIFKRSNGSKDTVVFRNTIYVTDTSGSSGGNYQLPYNGNSAYYLGGDTIYHALPNSWNVSGNAGTTSNFIGTTNNVELMFRVNNVLAGRTGTGTFSNTSFGAKSQPITGSGLFNASFGSLASASLRSGGKNTDIGYEAGYNNLTGNYNTRVGEGANIWDTSSSYNVVIGAEALNYTSLTKIPGGGYNTALGTLALNKHAAYRGNIGLGYFAGNKLTGNNTLFVSDSAYHMYFKLDSVSGTAPSVIGKDANGFWHVYAAPTGGSGTTYTASNGLTIQGNDIKIIDTLIGDSGYKFALVNEKHALVFGQKYSGNIWSNALVGYNSVTLGENSKATGNSSLVGGYLSTASGIYGLAFGEGAVSSGRTSTSFGNNTTAAGDQSVAINQYTNATGANSFSAGYGSNANGDISTSFGYGSVAKAYGSMAAGNASVAGGNFSFALGTGVKSKSASSMVIGSFNDSTNAIDGASVNIGDRVFQVGIGTSDTARKNALTILYSGKTQLNEYGKGNFTGTLAKSLGVDANGNVIEYEASAGSGGTTETASNGLTKVGNDIQLGGILTQNTTINTNLHTLTIQDNVTNSLTGIVSIINSGIDTATALTVTSSGTTFGKAQAIKASANNANAVGIWASGGRAGVYADGQSSGSSYALIANGGSNAAVYANSSTGGVGLEVISSLSSAIRATGSIYAPAVVINAKSNSVNSVKPAISIFNSATSPTSGFGLSLDFSNTASSAGAEGTFLSNQIISKWTDAFDATRTSEFSITGVDNTVTKDLFRLSGAGLLTLVQGAPEYTDNAAAVAAGLLIGTIYRTGDIMKIVH